MLKPGYGLDSNGYIISDVSLEKINSVYMACIQKCIENLKNTFPLQLHSVYVYGSVARGEAVAAKSDIDLIAMFDKRLSDVELSDLKKLTEKLSQNYKSLVREIGVAVAYYDDTLDPHNVYENAFLKELCVCVYGEDVRKQFGPYKLTSEIAVRFNGDIGEVLASTLDRLINVPEHEYNTITQNFARKLIRTYYSMVMVRSQIWTTRLRQQADVVIQHFPNKKKMVCTLLKWVEEPPTDRKTVYTFFKSEGEWAKENFTHEAHTSS